MMKPKYTSRVVILASVFAIGAIGASAASAASTFHTSVHPQTINGAQSATHVFTTDAGTVECKKATFTGTTSAKTSATQTMTPNYDECTAFGFINVDIKENGCAYIFNANGTTEVECPSGKQMAILAPFCTTTIGPQHIAAGMSYGNGSSDIVATTNIKSEIDYNECGTNKTNGTYTGTTTVQGASGSISVS